MTLRDSIANIQSKPHSAAMTRLRWPKAYELACSPDGRFMAAVGRNVVVIDLDRRERVSANHDFLHPSSLTFSPSGDVLAVKSTSGHIVMLDPTTGTILSDFENKKEGEGSNLAFSSNGEYLIDGSWNGNLTLRDVSTGKIVSRDEFPGEMITRVTHDERLSNWAIEHQPKVRPSENMPLPGYVSIVEGSFTSMRGARFLRFDGRPHAVTMSPDGNSLCFHDRSRNEICIARVDGGEMRATAPLELGGTGSDFAWSRDGSIIGAVASDGFRFFRSSDLAHVAHYSVPYPSSILFHPNGREVLLGTWETTAIKSLRELCH